MIPKSWIPSDSCISKIKRLKYSEDAEENDDTVDAILLVSLIIEIVSLDNAVSFVNVSLLKSKACAEKLSPASNWKLDWN